MILVELATATICFLSQCYPALVGPDTPRGEFQVQQRTTKARGYGGDVLVFKETAKDAYAIHRVYTLKPEQRRMERLTSGDPKQRVTITLGCINVMPEVYDKLVDCCSNSQVVIK